MGIIRKDYTLDRWVYYAASRKDRPHEFKKTAVADKSKICFFCPLNEHLTPPEIGRVEYKGGWKMRWFLNKFPAVELKVNPKFKARKFFSEGRNYGIHEIIVETSHHKSQLWDLPVSDYASLLEIYKARMKILISQKGVKYVEIFKNHGKDAGTSLIHSHSQVVAIPQIPELVKEEADAAKRHKSCPYCEIVRLESKSKRKIFETKNVIAFAPFASRFNYEAWIFPKKHKKTLEELNENELKDFAAAMKKILLKA